MLNPPCDMSEGEGKWSSQSLRIEWQWHNGEDHTTALHRSQSANWSYQQRKSLTIHHTQQTVLLVKVKRFLSFLGILYGTGIIGTTESFLSKGVDASTNLESWAKLDTHGSHEVILLQQQQGLPINLLLSELLCILLTAWQGLDKLIYLDHLDKKGKSSST